MFTCFDRKYERDTQTDRHCVIAKARLWIALHSKNMNYIQVLHSNCIFKLATDSDLFLPNSWLPFKLQSIANSHSLLQNYIDGQKEACVLCMCTVRMRMLHSSIITSNDLIQVTCKLSQVLGE